MQQANSRPHHLQWKSFVSELKAGFFPPLCRLCFFFFFLLTSKWAHKIHVRLDRSAGDMRRAHTKPLYIFAQPFPRWAWLTAERGQKGPSNRCGTKKQQALYLFTPALCFTPPPTFLSSSTLNICISFQLPSDDVGQRHNYPARAASRAFLFWCCPRMWTAESEQTALTGGKLHAIYCSWHSNMKPGTQTHVD